MLVTPRVIADAAMRHRMGSIPSVVAPEVVAHRGFEPLLPP